MKSTIFTDMSANLKNYVNKWLTLLSRPFIRFTLLVFTCVIIFAVCSIVYRIDPSLVPVTPPCSLRYFTGLYCPGCGMTRAVHSVMNLRFGDAFSYNLLWPLIVMFIAVSLYMWFSFLITGKSPFIPFNRFLRKHSIAAYLFIAVLFAFWILRNIPVYPFTLLAP